MPRGRLLLLRLLLAAPLAALPAQAQQAETVERTFRLCEGVTLFILNPEGKDFSVSLDVRDLNLLANGPREVLFKVYDPEGFPVVREIIPDDGCGEANFPERIGGWDHELQYYANLYAKGTAPSYRWSAWSHPARLKTLVARTFDRPIPGGKRGVYRLVLAGTPDHYVTVRLPAEMQVGFMGHPTFMHGHGSLMKKCYLYVPPGTTGLFYAFAEPDQPPSRRFRLTGPDGKILFEGMATGGFTASDSPGQGAKVSFGQPGEYDGRLLTFEVSDGPNDYLAKITFQQGKPIFSDYVGMGVSAIFCPDEATAKALQGGAIVVDGQVFWHPFQVRFYRWLKANAATLPPDLRKDLEYLYQRMCLLENSDGRGSASWTNWAYAMGYYGCDIFRPGWVLMRRPEVPQEVKDIIREGLIMAGDRLSFATHIEKVNGNAFAQMNVALWYAQRATGDQLQKERFETFWQRWTTEGWGLGSGLSKSGDPQEHFAHDCHYGSYLLDNWKATGNTWVQGGGILGDAGDDPRFRQVYERCQELYSYLYCREQDGTPVAANPWSSRTHSPPHQAAANWETPQHPWKGDPGPDLTVSVNGGDEWFAARRRGYYVLTFHGRLAPEWVSQCFAGQLGFSGGTFCQLTVPGKGPVLAGRLHESYGQDMHPSQWAGLRIHSLVGEMWDRSPLIAAISEHDNARLTGNAVTSSGEVRNTHVRSARSYTFVADRIVCSVQLAPSHFAGVMSLWSHDRRWSEVREAWEMIPFLPTRPDGKTPTSVTTAEGQALTAAGVLTTGVRLDRGGFGVAVEFEEPRRVKLGAADTVMIEVVPPVPAGGKPVAPEQVKLTYRLAPFGV